MLQDHQTLELDDITPDFLDDVLFEYTVEAMLNDILGREGSPSAKAAESADILQRRETDLRATIRTIVDERLAEFKGTKQLSSMSENERRSLQLDSIRAVLEIWEAYEE